MSTSLDILSASLFSGDSSDAVPLARLKICECAEMHSLPNRHSMLIIDEV